MVKYMRDPERIYGFCMELIDIWFKAPDLRFNQLMQNFFSYLESKNKSPFYMEDDETKALLREYMDEVCKTYH